MGRFMVTAKVVDQVELDRLLDTAEMTMKESCDDKATMSQRKAGREEIQPETPSTKKAVADSEKALDEAMTRKQKDMAVRRFMSHDPKAGESILAMGKKDREEKKSFASAKKEIKQVKEEQIDEVSKKLAFKAVRSGSGGDPDYDHPKKDAIKDAIGRKWGPEAKKHADDADEGKERLRAPGKWNRLKNDMMSTSSRVSASGKKNKQDVASTKRNIRSRLGTHPKPGHLPEETLDEAGYDKLAKYVRDAHVSGTGAAARGEIAMHRGQKTRLHRANKTGEKREQGINLALDKMTGRALVPARRKENMEEAYEKQEAGVKGTPESDRHVLHRRNPGHDTEYHTISTTHRGGKALDRPDVKVGKPKYIKKIWDKLEEAFGVYRKGGSVGEKNDHPRHGKLTKTFDSADDAKSHAKSMNKVLSPGDKKYYRMKYHVKPIKEDTLDEGMAPVKKSYAMRKMKKKVSTQVKQGLGVEKGKDKTILVTNKGDPHAATGGGVHRIPRDKYDPSKHNMASE
jgi:hypothetical protein